MLGIQHSVPSDIELGKLAEGRDEWINISPTIRSAFKQLIHQLRGYQEENETLVNTVERMNRKLDDEIELREKDSMRFQRAVEKLENQFKEKMHEAELKSQKRWMTIETMLMKKADTAYVSDALLMKANKSETINQNASPPWESSMFQLSKLEGALVRLGTLEMKFEQLVQQKFSDTDSNSESQSNNLKLRESLSSLTRSLHRKANKKEVAGAFEFLEDAIGKLESGVNKFQTEIQSKLHVLAFNIQKVERPGASKASSSNEGLVCDMKEPMKHITELKEEQKRIALKYEDNSEQIKQLRTLIDQIMETINEEESIRESQQSQALESELQTCRQLARASLDKSSAQSNRIESLQEDSRKISLELANVKHSVRLLETTARITERAQEPPSSSLQEGQFHSGASIDHSVKQTVHLNSEFEGGSNPRSSSAFLTSAEMASCQPGNSQTRNQKMSTSRNPMTPSNFSNTRVSSRQPNDSSSRSSTSAVSPASRKKTRPPVKRVTKNSGTSAAKLKNSTTEQPPISNQFAKKSDSPIFKSSRQHQVPPEETPLSPSSNSREPQDAHVRAEEYYIDSQSILEGDSPEQTQHRQSQVNTSANMSHYSPRLKTESSIKRRNQDSKPFGFDAQQLKMLKPGVGGRNIATNTKKEQAKGIAVNSSKQNRVSKTAAAAGMRRGWRR